MVGSPGLEGPECGKAVAAIEGWREGIDGAPVELGGFPTGPANGCCDGKGIPVGPAIVGSFGGVKKI